MRLPRSGCGLHFLIAILIADGGQVFGGEDAVDIEDHDELRIAFAHAADEVGADLVTDAGRRLDLVGLEVDDLFDGVGQRADDGGLVVEHDFDDDDAGVAGGLGLRHPEAEAEIDDGDDGTAEIDDAAHELRGAGNGGDGSEVEDLSDLRDIGGEDFIGQAEGEVLAGLGLPLSRIF